ncbi:MAG: hypothetical protein JSS98_04280, partial [Bacteroidetes bacterium]|nr:hypothetical protein [Bacteroidota bacterium]
MNRIIKKRILESAERNVYKKRPIDTLNEIQQLKKKIESDKLAQKNVKVKVFQKTTPTGVAISKAKMKRGKKAMREQLELNEFQKKLDILKSKGASQEQIEDFYKKEFKIQKMQKELKLLEDQPEKYMAKLQELNQLQRENNVADILKEQTSQLKNQNTALAQLVNLYSGLLTPAQLLESTPEFQDLTAQERKVALDNLQTQIPRDRAKQKAFIHMILEQPDDTISDLKRGIKLSIPTKIKAQEIVNPPAMAPAPAPALAPAPAPTPATPKQRGRPKKQQQQQQQQQTAPAPVAQDEAGVDSDHEQQIQQRRLQQQQQQRQRRQDDDDDDDEDEVFQTPATRPLIQPGQPSMFAIPPPPPLPPINLIHPKLLPIVPLAAAQIKQQTEASDDEAFQDAHEVVQGVTNDLNMFAPPPPPPPLPSKLFG